MIKLLFALMLTIVPMSSLFSGGWVSGGGYAYIQSNELLDKAIQEIIAEADKWKDQELSPENLKLIKSVIISVHRIENQDPSREVFRDGKKLRYDYKLANPELGIKASIVVLPPFFDAYAGTTPEQYEDTLPQIKRDLIHEISHLWGLGVENDEESRKFAERIYPISSQSKKIFKANSNYYYESECVNLKRNQIQLLQDSALENAMYNCIVIGEHSKENCSNSEKLYKLIDTKSSKRVLDHSICSGGRSPKDYGPECYKRVSVPACRVEVTLVLPQIK